MATRRNWVDRVSALTGILAVILWIGGVAVMGTDHLALPGGLPEEGAGAVLEHLRANQDSVVSGSWLFMVGSVAFIWFAGMLRSRLIAPEGGVGTFTAIAFGGGVATGALSLGMPAGGLIAALGAGHVDASAAQALNAVEAIFFVGAELSAIVLVAATSVVVARTGVLARWWAVAGTLLAVWLVIAPIGWVGLLVGLPLWTLGTSVMLLQRLDRRPEPVGRGATSG
jgi:hypothetical protein